MSDDNDTSGIVKKNTGIDWSGEKMSSGPAESYLLNENNNYKSTKASDSTRWGKASQIDPEKQTIEYGSYLKKTEEAGKGLKPTNFSDKSRWGKAAEIDPEKQTIEYGSYLKKTEEAGKGLKPTNFSDKSRWGKAAEIDPEKVPPMEMGSYLQKQGQAQKEIAAKEAQKKAEIIQQLKDENAVKYLDPEDNVFPYDELKNKFPKGVDPLKKEYYLDDDEFDKVFGMTLDQFEKLAPFKKRAMKVKLGLF